MQEPDKTLEICSVFVNVATSKATTMDSPTALQTGFANIGSLVGMLEKLDEEQKYDRGDNETFELIKKKFTVIYEFVGRLLDAIKTKSFEALESSVALLARTFPNAWA